ncbi:PDZ domain-containing protein [Bacillaceae bacterium SIJ1]|uniref:S1C family serine protease n=1 Tax=Litoribacterium kuwaitense TaxID=1398745 RepID=UPI0013EC11DC|nr:trypsin-like peptidase domain-containing protein [Litoribacterium kuwaitense]NGP46296.1 PDZ domain-containing protein [Litoribacterium kuwaitense]
MRDEKHHSFEHESSEEKVMQADTSAEQETNSASDQTEPYQPLEITPYQYEDKRNMEDKKPKKQRKWLSPLIGAILGGALVFGMTTADILPGAVQSSPNTNNSITASPPPTATPVSTTNDSPGSTTADIAEAVMPTIVGIVNYQKAQQSGYPWFPQQSMEESQEIQAGTGSGFIFKKEGGSAYIATNNHVVEEASTVQVSLHNGEEREAEIVGTDPLTDLAVLKIDDAGIDKVAEFGESSSMRPGERAIAIGNPLGLTFSGTVTEGIVSGLNRSITVNTSAGPWELNVLQTDAAINPGNSGGPLLNEAGQVIGINTLKLKQEGIEGLGFAIPSEDALPIINELMEKGDVSRPTLGVRILDVSQIPQNFQKNTLGLFGDMLNNGVYVDSIEPGSAAEAAGVQSGDVIISINEQKIESGFELRRLLYKVSPGDDIQMKIVRNGETIEVSAQLSDKDMASPET